MINIDALQNNIKKRNFFAILLIGILVSISFLSLVILFKQQEQDGKIINLVGNQRMLSQKIAYLSYQHYHNLAIGIPDKSTNKLLFETTKQFSANQTLLTELTLNQHDTLPEDLSLLYFKEPISLNNRINHYIEHAITLSKMQKADVAQKFIQQHFKSDVIENLLIDLNLVVTKVELHVNDRIAYFEMVKFILWLATILLLISLIFFVFRPLQRIINNNYHDLYLAKKQSAELNFAIDKHAIVFRVNLDEVITITEVNQRFLELYYCKEEEVLGCNIQKICGDNYSVEYFKTMVDECLENEYWHGESISKIKEGRKLWLNTTIVPLKNNENKIDSFIIIQNEITDIKNTELVLNQLHKITSNVEKTLPDKIKSILELGKQIFNLPIGLLSEINNQDYKILYCDTSNNDIYPGDIFELEHTYCFHTFLADKAISFHQVSDSEIKNHPCYEKFGLESYIGAPLIVDGKRFGTLNFSGTEPSHRPFTDRELDLIQLFSHWISSEFTRANHEKQLLDQQSLMMQISDQARIGSWEVDMINHSIYWSKVTKEIHEVPIDYQPELTTAINFYKEGESRDAITFWVENAIKTGMSYDEDLQLVTAKGNDIWVSVRGQAVFENGVCVKLLGSFQDITEKVLAQHKITAHSQRMTLAADSAGFGVWEYNLNSDQVTWDDWMFKVYGVSANEVIVSYNLWEDSLHPDDKDETVSKLQLALQQKSKFETQYRIIWPDQTIKHIKASAIVICDSAGEVTTIIGVNYDVTERVQNEIALTKAKVQAEIAVKAKSEFFASMSHEIRTPMNGVLGMLDLLKDSKLNEEQKHRVGIAQQSATSLLSLINDVLDFSKIDANKLELENINFNFIEMLGDLVEAFAQQAQNKKLELILDVVDVKESLLLGDSNRIRQILTNLLSNAIKFTKEGAVTLRIKQTDYSTSHWGIFVEVIDTGIGIPKAKQAALFEAFSQVDASTTREYGGTGLGLAIVKKLCICMLGTIRVESEKGKGSTFICELLLEKSPESFLSLPAPELLSKRVLIVDHNKPCGETIKRQLSRWKIDVTFITSGQEALSLLTSKTGTHSFDLMIINRDIPDEDEFDVVKKIRNHSELDSLKIIFMTSMNNQNDLAEYEQLGINGHFPKPVTINDLYRSLNKTIDVHESQPDNDSSLIKITTENSDDMNWKKKVKLLLVEDNRVNQMVAIGVLKKIGIDDVVIAINGIDAIDKLKLSDDEYPFNFIFMDCQMPEMDGYQATTLIREGAADSRYKNIPIVAMTANAMLGDEQKCLDAGMNDYLVKPINKIEINKSLQFFMSEK